jgi:hypothetical protein
MRRRLVVGVLVLAWLTTLLAGCHGDNQASQSNTGSGTNVLCQEHANCAVTVPGQTDDGTDTADPTQDGTTDAADPSAAATAAAATSSPLPAATGVLLGTKIAGPDADGTGIIVTRSENASYGMDIDAEDFSINGIPVTFGWIATCKLFCGQNETSYVDLALDRKYSRLTAVFGISDDSDGQGPLRIELTTSDGGQTKLIYTGTFTIGQGSKRTVNVTGILRLRISFIGSLGTTDGALGDPTLFS